MLLKRTVDGLSESHRIHRWKCQGAFRQRRDFVQQIFGTSFLFIHRDHAEARFESAGYLENRALEALPAHKRSDPECVPDVTSGVPLAKLTLASRDGIGKGHRQQSR